MPDFKTQNALVLSTRRLGERSFVISLFTRDNGRHLGVLQKKEPPQIGSFVEGRWQARLIDQLGTYYLEQSSSFSIRFLDDKKRLAALTCLCALLDNVLPERQNYSEFYGATLKFLHDLDEDDFLKKYVLWDKDLLQTIGFGLDCSKCAGGGDANDLAYISPKTGRAVSRKVGLPYHDKLLELPLFLFKDAEASEIDIRKGLNLTGFFLSTYTSIKSLPKIREQLY